MITSYRQSSLAVAMLLAASGTAQAALEEVIVTAEKREASLQDTSISIIALDGQQLDRTGLNELRDVLNGVPGINFSNNAFGATTINLRGVEGQTAAAGKTDPGVAINFDGVVQSNLLGETGASQFYDIDRIEVLRGPQGTLYGRGAAAGTVNVVSNDPINEFEAAGSLELGNYDLIRSSGMINVPLSDSWAARAAFRSVDRSGYYTSGANDADFASGRVKLAFDNDSAVSLLFGGEFTNVGGALGVGGMGAGIAAWGLGDPPSDPWDDVDQVTGSTQDDTYSKIWTEVNIDTGIGTLTILPSYSTAEIYQNLLRVSGGALVQQPNTSDANATTFEARLSSNDDSPFDWVLGTYYDTAEADNYATQFSRQTSQEQSSSAIFAQGTFHLSDMMRLIAGIRYTEDEKSFTSSSHGLSGDNTWDSTDWKLGLEYDLNDDSMLYGTIATGYRPGGIDTAAASTLTNLEGDTFPNPSLYSDSETLTTFEIGSKNLLRDGTLRLNVAAFYNQYENRQFNFFTTTADPDVDCPNNGAAPQFFGADIVCSGLDNAGDITTMGIEIDSEWQFTDADKIGLNLAWLDAEVTEDEYTSFSDPDDQEGDGDYIVTVNTNGATTPRSPDFSFNFNYSHFFELNNGDTLTLRGDVRHTGEATISGFNYLNPVIDSGGTRVGDYYVIEANTQYDASLQYESQDGRWSATLYGRNLTEEIVKSATDGSTMQVEPPRTYGLVISARM